MRRFGWLLLSVGSLACGGAEERASAPAPVVPTPTASPPAAAEVVLPESGHLPDNAAVYASLDGAAVDRWLGHLATVMPETIARLERNLGVLPGAMVTGNLLQSNGVDPQRPIVVAVSTLDVNGRTVVNAGVEQFAVLAARGFLPDGLARTMNKVLDAHREPAVHLRIVIPTKNSEAMLAAIRAFLFELECDPADVPEGFSEVCFHRNKSMAFSVQPTEVVMDYHRFVGSDPNNTDFVQALYRTRRAMADARGGVAPDLESGAVRVRYQPEALADVGFVDAIIDAHDGSGDQDSKSADWSMLAGLRSAGLVASLGKGVKGAHFESVDVRLDFHDALPEVRVEATYGPGFERSSAAACAPSRSVDFPGALSRFDLNTSCMRALKVPGDPARGPLSQSTFLSMFRDAQWIGEPVALPWYPLGLTRTPLHWYAGVGPEAMMRFERFGWSNPAFGEPDVFWGLMPAGATNNDVACAVAESSVGCRGRRQIAAGRLNDVGGAFVRVVKLGDRVVVLSSKDRGAVGAMTPKLTADSVPAFRAAVSKGTVLRELKERKMSAPETRYVGQLEVLGDRLRWVARPAD